MNSVSYGGSLWSRQQMHGLIRRLVEEEGASVELDSSLRIGAKFRCTVKTESGPSDVFTGHGSTLWTALRNAVELMEEGK